MKLAVGSTVIFKLQSEDTYQVGTVEKILARNLYNRNRYQVRSESGCLWYHMAIDTPGNVTTIVSNLTNNLANPENPIVISNAILNLGEILE